MAIDVTVIDGCTIRYDLSGAGVPVVLTPGGRAGLDDVRALGDRLARRYRVLQWDRRNTGAADVWIGEDGEQDVWADDLAELLGRLDLAPAYLLGGSAGARVSYLAALRHPEVVRGLVLWSVSGGPYAAQNLGYQNHTPFINEALRGGMEAVCTTPFFAERISANPANRERLLAMDPTAFVAALRRWNETFYWRPDTPVIGATAEDLGRIAVPTLVFEGNDDFHPAEAAMAAHAAIPGARLAPSPWTGEDWMDRFLGRVPGTVFDLYPRLLPAIEAFVDETDRARSLAR